MLDIRQQVTDQQDSLVEVSNFHHRVDQPGTFIIGELITQNVVEIFQQIRIVKLSRHRVVSTDCGISPTLT